MMPDWQLGLIIASCATEGIGVIASLAMFTGSGGGERLDKHEARATLACFLFGWFWPGWIIYGLLRVARRAQLPMPRLPARLRSGKIAHDQGQLSLTTDHPRDGAVSIVRGQRPDSK